MPYSKRLQFDNLVLDLVFFSHVLRLSDCWNIFLSFSSANSHHLNFLLRSLFLFLLSHYVYVFCLFQKNLSIPEERVKELHRVSMFKSKKKKNPKEQDGEM